MKKIIICLLVGILIGGAVIYLVMHKSPTPKIEPAVKNSFSEVTSKLDQGGNLYLYYSTERVVKSIEEFAKKLRKIIELQVFKPNIENNDALKIFDFVFKMFKNSGLTEISGIGISSIKIEKNLNNSKIIVHHYKKNGNGLIWRIMEEKPQELKELKLLPADTVMAGFINLRLNYLWNWIKTEIENSDLQNVKKSINSVEPALQKQGIDLKKLLDSLKGKIGYILTFDREKKLSIPIGKTPINIPEPGIAIVFSVKDDTIFNFIKTKLHLEQKSEKKGIKKLIIPVPPIPIPVKPEIVQKDDILILASHTKVVDAMLSANEKGNGLTSTEEFKKIATNIPNKGNGFRFVSPRLFQLIWKIQQKAIDTYKNVKTEDKIAFNFFKSFQKNWYFYGVLQNTEEGTIFTFNHNSNIEYIVILPAIASAGIMAAIAIPNILKSAHKSKQKLYDKSTIPDLVL